MSLNVALVTILAIIWPIEKKLLTLVFYYVLRISEIFTYLTKW